MANLSLVIDDLIAANRILAAEGVGSGDRVAIAAYLGPSDKFDQSITDFSARYADQNDQDYRAFTDAVHTGRITALEGV